MLAVQGRYSFRSTCHRENNVTPGFKGILRNQQNERFILNEENQRVRHCNYPCLSSPASSTGEPRLTMQTAIRHSLCRLGDRDGNLLHLCLTAKGPYLPKRRLPRAGYRLQRETELHDPATDRNRPSSPPSEGS